MTRVILFGKLSDIAGWRAREVPDQPDTTALAAWLGEDDPALGEALTHSGVRIAINQVLMVAACPLAPGAEVAFMPPMSGG